MRRLTAALVLVGALGCGTGAGSGDASDAGAIDVAADSAPVEAAVDVGPVDPCGPSACGADELCGSGAGDGLDNDCDGLVDEGCPCAQYAAEPCFPASPDHRGIGACHDGTAVCSELGIWGSCQQAVVPRSEVCDGVDNDCDGRADEDLPDCSPALRCPPYATARPLADYTMDGAAIDPLATAFHWTFECPPEITTCPAPADPAASTLRVRVVQSGTYVVQLAVTHADGTTGSCFYPLYVRGDGLRVELDWDTKGGVASAGTDLDLHVATMDPTQTFVPAWFTPADCYYATCVAPGGRVYWTTSSADTRFAPNADVAACAGAPAPYGDAWRTAGRCWNPRLDADDVTCDPTVADPTALGFCYVENVNVDVAPENVTFRLMVNFYEDHGSCADARTDNDVTHPRVRVFCGGALRAELGGGGEDPVAMPCALNAGRGSENFSWLAADVRFFNNACGVQDCAISELRASAPGGPPPCETLTATQDECADAAGRIFVRRAGARPVAAEVGDSFYP